MTKSIEKLLSISSAALGPKPAAKMPALLEAAGKRGAELWSLLSQRNGFLAFESALHVFPAGGPGEQSVERWNSPDLWRSHYQDLTEGCLFFAEDLFGGQFCIKEDRIHAFDPETGELEELGASVEAWARALLGDFETLTGQPLANAWQEEHGAIPKGKRLLPKTPFVAGGEFELGNLYLAEAVKGMKFRGDLALQIRDLPEGAQIKFKVVE